MGSRIEWKSVQCVVTSPPYWGRAARQRGRGDRVKTLYDWHPEHRGWLLMPQGSTSIRHSVIVSGLCGHDVFLEMYERGHLTGQALADATARYGAETKA